MCSSPIIHNYIQIINIQLLIITFSITRCHGEKDNVVFQMARSHDLLQSNTLRYDDFAMYRSDGSVVPDQSAADLMQLAIGILESDDDEFHRHGGSLGDFFVSRYTAAVQESKFDATLADQFLDFFHKYENSYEASDSWFDASAIGYTQYWDCAGDLLLNWRDRGYQMVFDLLMNRVPGATKPSIPVEERIRFGQQVCRIEWATVDNQSAATVECSDGTRWTADHVICTVSLGVLKERTPLGLFVPPLPASKLAAIDALTLGTVDKIYLHFAEPFWPADWKGFSLLWTKADRELLRPEDAWMESVFGMYRVDFQPNILCGWISGPNARHMETLSEEQVYVGVVRLLHQFLDRSMRVQEPLEIKRSQWFSDPHFRGSYTFRTVRADELHTDPAALAAPLLRRGSGVPVLQFAGEATHDHYFSTVHGAIETGWREARRLIDFYSV